MVSRIGVVIVSCLATVGLAGCTADTATTSTVAPSSTSTTAPAGPGRLAVLDDEGRVVLIDPDGSDPVEIAAPSEDEPLLGQPIWSTDGSSVSYAKAGPDGFSYVIHDLDGGEPSEVSLEQFPFYASWSPDGTHLGLLRNGDTGVVFELVDLAGPSTAVTDTATPFYFSWRPGGGELVSHAGPTRLVSRDDNGLQLESASTDAAYLAPQWLDQGVLHVEAGHLVIDTADGARTSVAAVTAPTYFVANRQGTMVAVQGSSSDPAVSVALEDGLTIAPNTVSVVDLESGEVAVAHDGVAIAFFWSPDGESLLLLSVNPDRDALNASVWSGGDTREYVGYLPHPAQVRDVFPFFPQYAQSMSYWSSDSSAFALVGEIDGQLGVWVQHLDDSAPVLVSGGSWAAWAP